MTFRFYTNVLRHWQKHYFKRIIEYSYSHAFILLILILIMSLINNNPYNEQFFFFFGKVDFKPIFFFFFLKTHCSKKFSLASFHTDPHKPACLLRIIYLNKIRESHLFSFLFNNVPQKHFSSNYQFLLSAARRLFEKFPPFKYQKKKKNIQNLASPPNLSTKKLSECRTI